MLTIQHKLKHANYTAQTEPFLHANYIAQTEPFLHAGKFVGKFVIRNGEFVGKFVRNKRQYKSRLIALCILTGGSVVASDHKGTKGSELPRKRFFHIVFLASLLVFSYALPSHPSYRSYSEGMNGNGHFQYPKQKDAAFSDAQRNGVYGESIPFPEALETMSDPESDWIDSEGMNGNRHFQYPNPKDAAFSDAQRNGVYGESIPFPEVLETMSDPESDWIYSEGINGNGHFQYPNPKDAAFSDAQRNGVYGESIPFPETISDPESDWIYSEGINGNGHFQYPNPKDAAFSDAQRNGVYGESIPFPEVLETMSDPESDWIYSEGMNGKRHSQYPKPKDAAFSDAQRNGVYGESIPFPEEAETMSDPESDWINEEDDVIDHESTDCDFSYRPRSPNDPISPRFFDNHICVYRRQPPDITKFCRNFRHGINYYTVMILTPRELDTLRKDLRDNQTLYERHRAGFPPQFGPPSNVRFYTTHTYPLFYECKYVNGHWNVDKLTHRDEVFTPMGAARPYKIYHGCDPTKTRPKTQVGKGNC